MGPRARLAVLTARRDVRLLTVLVALELFLLGSYGAARPGSITRPRYLLYPFVWMNAAVWAIFHTDPPTGPVRRRIAGVGLALSYLTVLFWLAGLVGPAPPDPGGGLSVTVALASPGWERVTLVAGDLSVTLIPYRVAGYLALSYLVYVTAVDAASAVLGGALGLVSCVGCTFPIVLSLTSGVFGGSSAVAGAVFTRSVDLSTVVFLLALAMLYYRPGFGTGPADQRME
jgi:hypothetical protein